MTNPESPPSHNLTKKQNGSFEYKERVENCLIKLGIPFEKARVAVIDLRSRVYKGQQDKLNPLQTAAEMLEDVRRIYKCTS
jgi:hypothetical protein